MVDKNAARQELARRELARRRGAVPAAAQSEQPWYSQLGQAADDVLRIGSNAITFGFRDKLAPYATGRTADEERGMTQAARDRAGTAGFATELLAGAAVPIGAARAGMTAMNAVPAGLSGAKGLAARTGAMAADGSLYGAATAAGNDQDILSGMGMGAAAGAAGSLAGETLSAGIGKVAGAFNKKPAIPTAGDIDSMKRAAYKAADDAGVIFTPNAVNRVQAKVNANLADFGYDPELQPGVAVVLRRLDMLKGQNVTLGGLDTIRKVASNGYVPGNKSNNKAIADIIDAIDDVIGRPAKGDVLMGDAARGIPALKMARQLAARSAKLEKVTDAVQKADLRAASTGSGGNADNATRQNLRRILEKPRGFTADEKAALESVVRGTSGQNALRLAGKLSPSGSGLMAALGVGGAMVNPMIGALSLGGMGAKAAADSMTGRNVQELAKIIAAGGSRAATQAPPNAVQALAQSKRDAIARALMGIGVQQTVTP
jgi:hypothetical protein